MKYERNDELACFFCLFSLLCGSRLKNKRFSPSALYPFIIHRFVEVRNFSNLILHVLFLGSVITMVLVIYHASENLTRAQNKEP